MSASADIKADNSEELSPEQLAKLSKEERKAYHAARLAARQNATEAPKVQLTKAQRREIQEQQRKTKEDKLQDKGENTELLAELRLQGLSEEQAREVMAEMLKSEASKEEAGENDDEEDGDDLLSSVREWMAEQGDGKVPKQALSDFNMKVRFQGHVESTPPDHLFCILRVLVEEALKGIELSAPKLQPTAVAQKAEVAMTRWRALLEVLYKKIDDVMEATERVIHAVVEGVAAASREASEENKAKGVVGCLMACREIDFIEDEDLLAGCRAAVAKSLVMDKFIEFLEEALEEDDDDEK